MIFELSVDLISARSRSRICISHADPKPWLNYRYLGGGCARVKYFRLWHRASAVERVALPRVPNLFWYLKSEKPDCHLKIKTRVVLWTRARSES